MKQFRTSRPTVYQEVIETYSFNNGSAQHFVTLTYNIIISELSNASTFLFREIFTYRTQVENLIVIIHPLIVILIISGSYILKPLFVVKVPLHCLLNSFLEL